MKVATYNLSKIVRNAWYLKKSQPSMTFSACLRKAWRNVLALFNLSLIHI